MNKLEAGGDVLVVDDNVENLKIVTNFLSPLGYNVRVSLDGEKALRVIGKKQPDLVLLDIQIPHKNGFELLQELVNHKKYKEIPIILISAYSDIENKVKAFELGATDFIEKPFQLKEVIARVNYHMRNTRRKKKLQQTLQKLKESQVKIVQNEKLASIGVLSAGLSHELNNPINYINAGVTSLELDVNDLVSLIELYENELNKQSSGMPPSIKAFKEKIGFEETLSNLSETIKDIQFGVKRSTEIINNLNHYTRLHNKQKTLVDINEELKGNVKMLQKLSNKQLEIIEEYDEQAKKVRAFEGELGQVFMNLLKNAEQASEKNAQLIVRTRVEGKNAIIEIEDFGTGVPKNLIDKLFDPFQTTKKPGEGTGLGLSISHTIIKLHGGNLDFKNKKSKGTIFTVSLPK